MTSQVFNFLGDNSIVEVVVLTLVLFLYSAIRFSLKSDQLEKQSGEFTIKLEKQSDDITKKLDKHSDDITKKVEKYSDDITKKVEKHSDDIRDLKIDVRFIKEQTRDIFGNTGDSAFKASSPLKLTETGYEISKAIRAEEILARHEQSLKRIVLDTNPPTAYHLQIECMNAVERHLESELSAQDLTTVSREAVQRGLPLSNVLGIFGILLKG